MGLYKTSNFSIFTLINASDLKFRVMRSICKIMTSHFRTVLLVLTTFYTLFKILSCTWSLNCDNFKQNSSSRKRTAQGKMKWREHSESFCIKTSKAWSDSEQGKGKSFPTQISCNFQAATNLIFFFCTTTSFDLGFPFPSVQQRLDELVPNVQEQWHKYARYSYHLCLEIDIFSRYQQGYLFWGVLLQD